MATLLDCALCLEEFTDPKQLPCTHTFCLQCLEELIRTHPGNKFPCPECRASVKVGLFFYVTSYSRLFCYILDEGVVIV